MFYREGNHATGVDTEVERSGVSKTSLYRLFESKDALITAFAAEQDRLFWARWDRIEEQHADDPRALLEALLSGIAERIGRPAYRGCPFFNLATEFPDKNHPGRVVARGTHDQLLADVDGYRALVTAYETGDVDDVVDPVTNDEELSA